MEDMPYAFVVMSALSSAVALLVGWAGLRRYLYICHCGPGFYPLFSLHVDSLRYEKSDSLIRNERKI